MIRIIVVILFSCSICQAQTDWEYWDAAEASYTEAQNAAVNQDNKSKSITGHLLSSARSVYSFLISDLDGDNCPFHPTCSEFFVQAAGKTNILKSVLMFTDRFTRDMNLGKGTGQYLLSNNNRFYDPVDNYLLDENKINHIPIHTE